MVNRLVGLLFFISFLQPGHPALGAEVPRYRVGDVATNTVVTPVALMVREPKTTALLEAQARQEVQTIVRYSPTMVDEVEAAFRSHMVTLRDEFVREVEGTYGRRTIEKRMQYNPKWLKLSSRFRESHRDTPNLSPYLALWSQGLSDEPLLSERVVHLRRAMTGPLRPDEFPPADAGAMVLIVTVPTLDTHLSIAMAERHGVLTPADQLPAVSQVRSEMVEGLPAEDRFIGRFLEQFVRPNCVIDEALTRLARQSLVDARAVATRYPAGETLVQAGQVIDVDAVAALDALRGKLEGAPPATSAGVDENRVPSWLLAAAGGSILLVVVLLGLWLMEAARSRGRSMEFAAAARSPAMLDGAGAVASVSTESMASGSVEQWRDRALAAELKAEQAKEMARTTVANALRDKVVEHLTGRWGEMKAAQEEAAERMVGLDGRLERIQGLLNQRVQAYEQRIVELECELATKDEENRMLIRREIRNLRERMARERAGDGPPSFDLN